MMRRTLGAAPRDVGRGRGPSRLTSEDRRRSGRSRATSGASLLAVRNAGSLPQRRPSRCCRSGDASRRGLGRIGIDENGGVLDVRAPAHRRALAGACALPHRRRSVATESEELAREKHGISPYAAACRNDRACVGLLLEALDDPASSVAALMSAMSPRQMSAARASSGKAAIPAMSGGGEAFRMARISNPMRSSPARRSASFSGSCPVTRRTGRAREARTASARSADQRLAAEIGDELVRAHPGRAAGGQDDRGDAHVFGGSARGCGLDLDLHEEAADAHRHHLGPAHGQAREQALEHPIEAVLLRAARAAGRAEHRRIAELGDEKKIAGIDRHAEMLDAASGGLDRGGNDVAPIGNGRGAEDDHDVGRSGERAAKRLGERLRLMRHALLEDDDRFGGLEALGQNLHRLRDDGGLEPRQKRGDRGDAAARIRRDADERRAHLRHRLLERVSRHGVRDDLHRRHHLARAHRAKRRQGREGDRLVDGVHGIDTGPVEPKHAASFPRTDWRGR